jgi:hypothetical protein
MPVDELEDATGRIVLEIAVHDLVLLSPFEHRSERENSKRQPSVARPRSTRMIEDDHALTRAA